MTVKTETRNDSLNTMTVTRRGFVKVGGALFVSLYIPGAFATPTRLKARLRSTRRCWLPGWRSEATIRL